MDCYTARLTEDGRWGYFHVIFRGRSSHSSSVKKVYKGKGRGRVFQVGGNKLVVKVIGEDPATKEDCAIEVAKASMANDLAHAYSETCLPLFAGDSRVLVKVSHLAQVDTVTVRNARKRRPITDEEWVLVEPDMHGTYEVFVGRNGKCLTDEGGLLATFAHYTYHVSRGERLVCNLQGVRRPRGFQLVSPTVHSTTRSFGPHDNGLQGMELFFRNHECTQTCRYWLLPQLLPPESHQRGVLQMRSSDLGPIHWASTLRSDGYEIGNRSFDSYSISYQDSPPPYHVAVLMPPTFPGAYDAINTSQRTVQTATLLTF